MVAETAVIIEQEMEAKGPSPYAMVERRGSKGVEGGDTKVSSRMPAESKMTPYVASARPTTPLDCMYGDEEKDFIDGVLDQISPTKNAAINEKWKDLQEEFKKKASKPKPQFDLTPSEDGPWRKGAAPMKMFMDFLQAAGGVEEGDLERALDLSERILDFEPNNKIIKQYQPALLKKKEMIEKGILEEEDSDSEEGWDYGDSVDEFFEEVLEEGQEEVGVTVSKVLIQEHRISTVGDLMAIFKAGEDEIQQLLQTVGLDLEQIDSAKEALQEIEDDEDEEDSDSGEEEEETKEEEFTERFQGLLAGRNNSLQGSSKENEAPRNEDAGNRIQKIQMDGQAQAKQRIGGGFEAKGPSPYALTEKGEK
jgi:hypothetical protein